MFHLGYEFDENDVHDVKLGFFKKLLKINAKKCPK